MSSVYVVIAPSRRAVGAELDPLQLAEAAQVDEHAGWAARLITLISVFAERAGPGMLGEHVQRLLERPWSRVSTRSAASANRMLTGARMGA
jgi:hypothetical protein